MGDCMKFPDTVEEFMEQYKVTDYKQVYTNGTELVPIFRMKQWFERQPSADVLPYTIDPDGTLTITVPKGTEVSRVLVQEEGTQWGGLFYAD